MADSDTLLLTLGERIAALGTRLDNLQTEITDHRERDNNRFETIESELVALRDLVTRAIAERNRAIAALARQMRGGGDVYAGDFLDFISDRETA